MEVICGYGGHGFMVAVAMQCDLCEVAMVLAIGFTRVIIC